MSLKRFQFFKKMTAMALAGAMIFGMSCVAMAEPDEPTTPGGTTQESTDHTLLNDVTMVVRKDYQKGSESQKNTKSPAEDFVLTITNYGCWNVGEDGKGQPMYTVSTMPAFTEKNIIQAYAGEAEASEKSAVNIPVPTYAAVGDYWYKVVETDNEVAGVIYATNDGNAEDITKVNGNHDRTYYIHVQVTNGSEKGNYVRTVTLHQFAPDASATTNAAYESWMADAENKGKKVTEIQNKYYAGSLEVEKVVTGNAGDKKELFEVTVVFKNDSRDTMNSDITYQNFYDANGNLTTTPTSIGWNGAAPNATKEVTFYVMDGTTVRFDNIPYGVTYTVTETQPDDDKYTHVFSYTSADEATTFDNLTHSADTVATQTETNWDAANASGSIIDDLDHVIITNEKTSDIDVGVFTSNAPYYAILLLCAGSVVVMIGRRRKLIEE